MSAREMGVAAGRSGGASEGGAASAQEHVILKLQREFRAHSYCRGAYLNDAVFISEHIIGKCARFIGSGAEPALLRRGGHPERACISVSLYLALNPVNTLV